MLQEHLLSCPCWVLRGAFSCTSSGVADVAETTMLRGMTRLVVVWCTWHSASLKSMSRSVMLKSQRFLSSVLNNKSGAPVPLPRTFLSISRAGAPRSSRRERVIRFHKQTTEIVLVFGMSMSRCLRNTACSVSLKSTSMCQVPHFQEHVKTPHCRRDKCDPKALNEGQLYKEKVSRVRWTTVFFF